MNPAEDLTASVRDRPCNGLEIPVGAAGLDVLIPALRASLDGSGPALALLPAFGSGQYRSKLRAAVLPGEPVPSEVAVVAATSGSTGNPAGVLMPGSALRVAAVGFARFAGQPDGHRWVAALPLHHAGGLMVAVRSVVAGTEPIALASLGGAQPFTVEAFAAATALARALGASDGRPVAVSLVPAMLSLLVAAGDRGVELLGGYDAVLVGGAAAPAALVDRLRRAGVRVFTSYGMTETCGGAVFNSTPLTGVTVDTELDGRLGITGEQVALGYRDGREPDRWSTAADGRRRFRTDDVGRVGADGLVAVTGRADEVVQVAGASVSLAAVREVLVGDPRVQAAELVAVPDPRWGSVLVAMIVPAWREFRAGAVGPGDLDDSLDPGDLGHLGDLTHLDSSQLSDLSDLASVVERELGRAARPRVVHAVPALPLLESGKVDRTALLALARDLDGSTP